MSPKTILKSILFIVWWTLISETTLAQTMYVLTEGWKVAVINMQTLEKVDSFEVIQQPPPLIERASIAPAYNEPRFFLSFLDFPSTFS